MKTILRTDRFSCPSCVGKIERRLAALPGVEGAKVHFATGRMEIEHDPERASQALLLETVGAAGYPSRVARY